MKHEKFTITGMSCSAAQLVLKKAVNKLDGIDKASVNLLTNSMQADYDENVVSQQDIHQSRRRRRLWCQPGRYGKCRRFWRSSAKERF